jgi:hypothetical protein
MNQKSNFAEITNPDDEMSDIAGDSEDSDDITSSPSASPKQATHPRASLDDMKSELEQDLTVINPCEIVSGVTNNA